MATLGLITLLLAAVVTLIGSRQQEDWIWAILNPTSTPSPSVLPTPTPAPPTPKAVAVLLPTVTPTPLRGEEKAVRTATISAAEDQAQATAEGTGKVHTLIPPANQVGWWVSDEAGSRQIGDSFLYAGQFNAQTYVSLVRFDISKVARGAAIRSATLKLTGLRSEGITADTPNRWVVQFIAEETLPDFVTPDFLAVFSAPAAITLLPELPPTALGVGVTNEWQLDKTVRQWLERQLLDGATSITVRLMASANGDGALFAWDSGYRSESNGSAPALVIEAGPPPPTPPPLPTRALMVATLTPLPANVLTAVAQSATATAHAAIYGTPTPVPHEIATPTPFPANLATMQASAAGAGQPAVVLNTPVPANAATAVALSEYATAVALTTGTFTPVPTGYVTPVLLYPPPPPENVATAAARVLIATAEAQRGAPTATVPWNGIYAIYVYATPTPGNAATAIARIQELNAAAVTTGTPTPTPWNLVVITQVPPPTPTEIPLVVPVAQLEPTPTPTPTVPVNPEDISQFQGMILFLSNRSGKTETWVLDPALGEVIAMVRDSRLHELARELYLANSPDGSKRAIVQADDDRQLEIQIYSNVYGTTQQITNMERGMSYDPAWSPLGDRIAFVSTVYGGDEIFVIDPQGTAFQRLTDNTWEWDKHPTWSPDGGQIAFFSNRDSGRRQIWIMNADGGNQRNLSNDEFENWDPVWVR